MVLPDYLIRKLSEEKAMIEPCAEPKSGGIVSYGISSYSYDMHLTDEFKVYQPKAGPLLIPKQLAKKILLILKEMF